MVGSAKAGKGQHRLKGFLNSWLEELIDGQKVKSWLARDPENSLQAICLVCPPSSENVKGNFFSVAEGFSAITKHAKGMKHKDNIESTWKDPNHNKVRQGSKQISIQDAVINQQEQISSDVKRNSDLLSSQILWANTVHSHGLGSKFFNCSSKLFPKMFADSAIAREWGKPKKGLYRTKGDYFGSDGIHIFLKEELVMKLRNAFFSLNFDKSSVLQTSQLNINVSFWEGSGVTKRNFTTQSLEGGSTAEEITDSVLSELDGNLIPKENLISTATDGCPTMIGRLNGVHAKIRDEVTHLPDFGGCPAHDASNSRKEGLKKLNVNIVKLYHAVPTYISSQSLHRLRKFNQVCREIGFDVKNPPKMFEVRFRVVPILAK